MLCGHQESHVSTLTNEKHSHTTDNDFQALDSAWTAFHCYNVTVFALGNWISCSHTFNSSWKLAELKVD